MTPLNVVRIASHSSTGMKKRTLARTLGIEDAEAGAGATLVACRLAGLSTLETHSVDCLASSISSLTLPHVPTVSLSALAYPVERVRDDQSVGAHRS
jgi:hypothetical protein